MGAIAGINGRGYAQYQSFAAAKTLLDTPEVGPALGAINAARAIIQAEGGAVRWTDDGTTVPTAAVGMLLPEGAVVEEDVALHSFKFIEVDAAAKLNVSYYGI